MASAIVARNSDECRPLLFEVMRLWHLVTVAALVFARDSAAAQSLSAMAQAIPMVTRADPTVGGRTLTEGYVTQPMIMAHAAWRTLRVIGTLNLEGLTLARGELSTGGWGEGYVDRRHPHAYAHELLAGVEHELSGVAGSFFAGRGFAPFGSDDPMARPFEKYPINHHLAQVLERVVAIAAVRKGPVIIELATFNGDEPNSAGEAPDFERFGDSWSSRLTLLPLAGVEVSGSFAHVESPEERTGAGLDQRKTSVVSRYSAADARSSRYALVEWARTNELDQRTVTSRLVTWLAEASFCRVGVTVAGRVERTDRIEEETTLDPFRVPQPAVDLSNLGISRWTTSQRPCPPQPSEPHL
jgi:hypothetical protein